MVSDHCNSAWHRQSLRVLILVVMEDGLRLKFVSEKTDVADVLILVVMEDGLRPATRTSSEALAKS